MEYNKMSRYYDKLLYRDVNYEKYRDFILEITKIKKIKYENYLDIACGTGNMTFQLSKYFKNVVAIDKSEEMLMIANEKSLKKRERIRFIEQDIRNIDTGIKFDLITSVLDATNYITDDFGIQSYFKGIKKSLKDDGIFIFDINSEYKLKNILGSNEFTLIEDDICYIWNNSIRNKVCTMEITFFTQNSDGTYDRFEEIHKERIYTEYEIEKIVESSGLKIVMKCDNYEKNKISNSSERITYILEKRN